MIHVNNKDISGVYSELKEIIAVYSGLKLVWQKNSPSNPDEPSVGPEEPTVDTASCYYNGYWIDEYPWTDNTPWTD